MKKYSVPLLKLYSVWINTAPEVRLKTFIRRKYLCTYGPGYFYMLATLCEVTPNELSGQIKSLQQAKDWAFCHAFAPKFTLHDGPN